MKVRLMPDCRAGRSSIAGMSSVIAVALGLVTAATAIAAVVPSHGDFAGTTSQPGGFKTSFRVSGAAVQNQVISWEAKCHSGKRLTLGTRRGRARVVAGRWSEKGTYSTNLRGGIVGRFRVIEDEGQFTSPISATGVFRLSAVLYKGVRKVDSCATGTVRWAAGSFAVGSPSPLIVPASEEVGGLSYAQWETSAWQWQLAYLHYYSSPAPSVTACTTAGQPASVWFLGADLYNSYFFTRTCTVPAGEALFLPGPSYHCSTVEAAPYRATTDAGLLSCAQSFRPPARSLALDGQVLSPAGLPVTTDAFDFTMPASNNVLQVPGATAGRAAVAGQPVMMRPLSPGAHTLVRVEQFPGQPVVVITYRLTVT